MRSLPLLAYLSWVLDYQRTAAEFGLGRLVGVTPLAGGHPDVVKLESDRGQFVIKPAGSGGAAQACLYEQVARVLNEAGVRQARPLRTTAGALISESGHVAQEFLPGRTCLHPTTAQTAAAMRHTGDYHTAISQVPVPAAPQPETIWTQVTRPGFLIERLPGLVRRSALPAASHEVVGRALRHLKAFVPRIGELAPQLVHGDIAPDNVLMAGDRVVAVIDFTPFAEPVMFAVATAVYWYHVYGRPALDIAAIRASLAAAASRPWTSPEIAAWPVMLLREALRRLATLLAVAEQAGTPAPAATHERYQAVCSILSSWPALQPDP